MPRARVSSPHKQPPHLNRLIEAHERSGLSVREVAAACDITHSYVVHILKGDRRPHRDVLIALGFAYRLDRMEIDEILLLADLPPLGRSVLREYRAQHNGGVASSVQLIRPAAWCSWALKPEFLKSATSAHNC